MTLMHDDAFDASTFHRTAKLFMDDGSAASPQAAMERLRGFRLGIVVDAGLAHSRAGQIALFTLVNMTCRTFLGGVEVAGLPASRALALYPGRDLGEVVCELGARLTEALTTGIPILSIGVTTPDVGAVPSWRITWQGWNGGVVPARDDRRLADDDEVAIAPAVAAAVGAAEAFAWLAGERGSAGRRAAGLSLWRPGEDWLDPDVGAPALSYLPSRLWLIGLGNLGQAFAWTLACLPYDERHDVRLVLQDDDRIAPSNESTSLLAQSRQIGERKTRVVAAWLEARGFEIAIEERRFGDCTRRAEDEPALAFCGVDNPLARSRLEGAGFGLVVEAGLGGGPQAFRSVAVHVFPGSRKARDVWSTVDEVPTGHIADTPAYAALEKAGADACGLAQLASRTVAVPFVGVTAACLALGEILRRLHGGSGSEMMAGSMNSLADLEIVEGRTDPFVYGHVTRSMTGIDALATT